MSETTHKTPEALLERLKEEDRARLRVYIGAAPGVGKTYAMLQEAHALKARGVDVVAGIVETYGRPDTEAQLKDLEVVPRRRIEYKSTTLGVRPSNRDDRHVTVHCALVISVVARGEGRVEVLCPIERGASLHRLLTCRGDTA